MPKLKMREAAGGDGEIARRRVEEGHEIGREHPKGTAAAKKALF